MALDSGKSSAELWLDVLDEGLSSAAGCICWIENAEMLHDSPWGSATVDRVISKGTRVVVCSREAVALPALSRIPPNERYTVGIEDLRFSESEASSLFPPGVQQRSVATAVGMAQGWPMAVLSYVRAAREGRLETALASAGESGAGHLEDYVFKEALSGLSTGAKSVLGAIALLRDCTPADFASLAVNAPEAQRQLRSSPFLSWSHDHVEVHPLASLGLASVRNEAIALLRDGAARATDPVRSAQLYVAAGDTEAAAGLLDTVLAPYFIGESNRDVMAIVSSIEKSVLVRHASTWCSTITLRAYAMSQHDLLMESRLAWQTLGDDCPIVVQIGVGLTLINSLLLLNHLQEADEVFGNLQERIDSCGATDARNALIGYRAFAELRRGHRVDVATVVAKMQQLFRDVPETYASALTSLIGPEAFMRGDRSDARRTYSQSLEIARSVASPIYLAIGLCNAAFYAWLAGETSLFEAFTEELVRISGPDVLGGTQHFIECATSNQPATAGPGFELRYLRAFGFIIAAARESTSEAKKTAVRLALDAAEEDGQPWLKAFCQIVHANIDKNGRDEQVRRATELAADVEYDQFRDGIAMLARGDVPDRWIGLRCLLSDSSTPLLRISLAANEVMLNGELISLSRREMELLFALALHDGPRDRQTLAAMLWPDSAESDGTAAATVYIARLRKRLKNARIIEASRKGYRLRCRVELDLNDLEEMAARGEDGPSENPDVEKALRFRHDRFAQWMLTSDWLAPYSRRYSAALATVRLNRAQGAKARGDDVDAALYRALLTAESGHDGGE